MTHPTDHRQPISQLDATITNQLDKQLTKETLKARRAELSLLRNLKLREQMGREEGWDELEELTDSFISSWELYGTYAGQQDTMQEERENAVLNAACTWFEKHPEDMSYAATARFKNPCSSYTLLAAAPEHNQPSALVLQTHALDTTTGQQVCIDTVEIPVTQQNWVATAKLLDALPARHESQLDTTPAQADTCLDYYLELMGLTEQSNEKLRACGVDLAELKPFQELLLDRVKKHAPDSNILLIGPEKVVFVELQDGDVSVTPNEHKGNVPQTEHDLVDLVTCRYEAALQRQHAAENPSVEQPQLGSTHKREHPPR